MTLKNRCPKCKGTGDMGFMSAQRCDQCQGTGNSSPKDEEENLISEFVEGYYDPETEDEWLMVQVRRIIKERKKRRLLNKLGTKP